MRSSIFVIASALVLAAGAASSIPGTAWADAVGGRAGSDWSRPALMGGSEPAVGMPGSASGVTSAPALTATATGSAVQTPAQPSMAGSDWKQEQRVPSFTVTLH